MGGLKIALESTIMIVEYSIEFFVYQNNTYIVTFSAILLMVLLLFPEKRTNLEEWRPR
jgi:hypothetical protein